VNSFTTNNTPVDALRHPFVKLAPPLPPEQDLRYPAGVDWEIICKVLKINIGGVGVLIKW
jgi:hypothetical protein